MERFLIAMSLLLASSIGTASSASLNPMEFKDQWDQTQSLTASTKWVIFSHDKLGGAWVKESFNNLKVTDLAERNWLYVADISAMPSVISYAFALPEMRDYNFSIALVTEEDKLNSWPKQPNTVSVYKTENLVLKEVHYFENPEVLQQFLMDLVPK